MFVGPALLCLLLLSGCFPGPSIDSPGVETAQVTTAEVETPPASQPGTPVVTEEAEAPEPDTISASPTEGPSADAVVGDLVPVAGVIDGDTIDVLIDGERTRIRVIGIDTPERGDCGYQEAASAMQSLVQSRDVHIEFDPTQGDTDRYNRLLRHVFTADGVNVAEEIIARGLGREYTYAAPYAYVADHLAAQADAREQGLGVWGETCDAGPPSVETPAEPVAPAQPPAGVSSQGCLIKGNINREGEHIYHQPGQQHYDDTKINESYGERWFCTPEDAEAAGWRAARR